MKIVHISDLHISSPHYVPEWGETVIESINSINPKVLVITGDLTNDGYMHEYELVKEFFDSITVENMMVVPGNHDARNEGHMIFEDMFDTRFPRYVDNNIVIVGLDSSEPDIDDGHVGREHYPRISDDLIEETKVKIIALHHHLIPIPGTGRERQIPTDAGEVLGHCTSSGVDFVLSGHKHRSWLWKLEDTYFITAGTATTRRLKGRSYPSFNVLDITRLTIDLQEINVEDGTSRELVHDTLI
jgi:3',5'-cyclic AMP phosphodiesterase CpdA